ncbi:2-oxoisovalerate dehydrogenase subunit beta [subsurface metagenome]
MRTLTYGQAIKEAIQQEMRRDDCLFILGEDLGYGGEHGIVVGLIDEFGPERVRDTAISEAAIIGAALGASCTGCRVIADVPFNEFAILGMDQIYNQTAKFRYMFGGKAMVPVVIRTAMGGYIRAGAHHSQCLEAWFAHVPGLITVTPSTPYDAKGLLKEAIRCDDPIMFFEHKALYDYQGEVPEGEYLLPLGKADIKREGTEVTVVAYSLTIHKVLSVAQKLKGEISVEVIDPRTLTPLDDKTILNSVKKTGRVVIVHEAWTHGGFGGEIAARIADQGFYSLDAPIKRVGAKHFPIPFAPELEDYILPQEEDIEKAIREVMG